MKQYFLLFLVFFSSFSSFSQDEETTYYLIRHAEKDRSDKTNRNPNLTEKGQKRAKNWATHFKYIKLDAVYSTNYNRTMQTAKPTADSKNFDILNYDPRNMFSEEFKKATQGKTVLIVGHSNTTPVFVNKILGNKKYKFMKDDDNASLYVVTIKKGAKNSNVKKVSL